MVGSKFKKVTPFLVLCAIGTIGLLYLLLDKEAGTGGWVSLYALKLFGWLSTILIADFILKYFLSKKAWLLWTIEILLCLCLAYYWIVT